MNREDMPEVLIVVLNYNGEGFLEDCLESLRENTEYPEESFTLLIVDNGSEDSSPQTAHEYSDEVIENERNLGFDIANNIGIYENPNYDYYMLLNNDTEFGKGWLSALVRTSEGKEAGIVGPKVVYPDHEVQSAGFIENTEAVRRNIFEGAPDEDLSGRFEVDTIHGCAMLISREVVDDIGYLDETFSMANHEEWDYCKRASKTGHRIYVEADAKVIHKEDKTMDQLKDDFLWLLGIKNSLKEKTMNGSKERMLKEYYDFLKRKFGASMIGYKDVPRRVVFKAFFEYLRDFPNLVHKRYNRTEFVPSYYCEGVKDYSKRYSQ